MRMKSVLAGIIAAALLVSSASAEITPLSAGKPAGTKQAALLASGPIFWVGLAVIGLGIGFAVSNNGNTITPTTGTGS